jgi:hypothetical protein
MQPLRQIDLAQPGLVTAFDQKCSQRFVTR